jgi:putative ABC transport system permease protein
LFDHIHIVMIKNYFKIAWRSLLKNKVTSAINIGGLSVGLAVAIIIMLWAAYEYSFDKFHTRISSIYMIMKNEPQGDGITTFQAIPGPLAPTMRRELPEIKYAARVSFNEQHLIRAGDKSFYENGIYAEPDYFKMMSFSAVAGNPQAALRDIGSVVISETTAKKLFGDQDPIGKLISHNNLQSLKVGAVIKDVPSNSSLKFDVVLPFLIYEKDHADGIQKWDSNSLITWVELKPESNLAGLNNKLTKIIRRERKNEKPELFAYPFAKLAMYGRFKDGKPNGGRIEMLAMLTILGMFVLIIACINFMNLSTARSEGRAREVGVRKSLGATKKSLIFQFLSEAFLMTFLALIVGVILAKLILPAFNQWTEKNISFNIYNLNIWTGLIATGIITGLLAGIYPAFFLSRFQPVKVLKGVITASKGGSLLRRGLVTFQFVISIFLMIVTIVIYRQVAYVQDRPIGYNPDNLIEIPARGNMADKFNILKAELVQIPAIRAVTASSDNLTGVGTTIDGLDWTGKNEGQDFAFSVTRVQYDWTKTTGLTMAEGRDFSSEYGTDTASCLVNMAAVKKMGVKGSALGMTIDHHQVIGVISDFSYNDVFSSPEPLLVYLSKGTMSHFYISLKPGQKWQTDIAAIESAVKKTNPEFPFEFNLATEQYQNKFRGIQSGGQFTSFVGILAIIISCMGIFALSAFVAERRTKEIGIRKVLGATTGNIWFSLSKDFLKPVFLAIIIASPLAALAMDKMLLTMEYHIQLSWWMFAVAGLMAIAIALVTVSFQGVKAALTNPVKSLRTE